MRKQKPGSDDGSSSYSSSSPGERTGMFLGGIGLASIGLGGIAAITGIGAGAAPVLFGFGAALAVVGGAIYITSGCFVHGTLVDTPEGLVPIEHLEAGDAVHALRPGGALVVSRVQQAFTDVQDQLVDLHLGDEVITCTPRHPFYRERWVTAENLHVGDLLLCREGKRAEVSQVDRRVERQSVHNLLVRGTHNYLVGQTGALVHNLKIFQ